MDKDRFGSGLTKRQEVLGVECLEKALESGDEFSREFQKLVTEYCWGTCWGEETLDKNSA